MNSNTNEESKGILNLVLIGAKSSGKTIYLSTLWGRGFLSATQSKTTKYLENTWNYIKEHKQAEATSGTFKMLHFNYNNEEFGRIDFSIDDYDGTFTETVSQGDENTKEERAKLFDSVKWSEGCIFFLPYENNPDRLQSFAQEIDAFVKLAQFESHSKSPIPASIVVTKWDESEFYQSENEDEKVLEYINSNEYLKRATEIIHNNFENVAYVPISSFDSYKLIEPIKYSFDNTFKQWYN